MVDQTEVPFEAISGFTGTGFSIIENVNSIDEPLLIWRSSSQWVGGLFFLLSIISTLGIKKIKIKPLYLITEGYEGGNFYHNFFVNFGKIFSVYTSITLIIFILFILSGVRFFDAFNLSFTVASAGGFLQTDSLSDIIKTNFQAIILSITLLFSIFNIFLIFRLFSMKLKLKEHFEDFYLLIIIVLFVLLLHLFFAPNENLVNIFLMITSSISTSGISLQHSNLNLSLMLILLTMVGGSVFSTSSGFKFLRIYVLFKSSLNEMYKLTKPINVFSRTLFKSDYKILDEDVKISFLIFIFFIFSIFVLSGLLTINNINFEDSFKLSILTLTNTVTSGMFGIYDLNFYELNNFPKISLMIFMILGKLELVAIFMLIKKFILR